MRLSVFLLFLTLSVPAFADDVRTVSKAALDAYQARDWATYLTNARKLDELRPNHPRVLYNLSGAWALSGNADKAIETLGRVAGMGVIYPAADDTDFDSIRDDDRFKRILGQFDANGQETGIASIAFTIDSAKGVVPEGVTRDPRSGTAWVSSVRDGAIFQVGADGSTSRLKLPDDIWSVTGLQYDAATNTLWFCTAATPMLRRGAGDDLGRSSIVAWDVKASKVARRFDLDNHDEPHWLGDLIVASDGSIYATDSRTPAIYRIEKGSVKLEKWLTSEKFVSLQGLTTDKSNKSLYVADYAKGIWSIDLKSREMSILPLPYDATVLGIDGLYSHRGDLIAIQNGTNPHRIIRIDLDKSGRKIERVETLEANRPDFDEPTLGVVQDDTIWFVATSQWGSFTDDGHLKEGAEEKPVVVMKRSLE